MKIEIRAIGFSLTHALEKHTLELFQEALLHQSDKISRVVIELSQTRGANANKRQRCRVLCIIPGASAAVANTREADLDTAIYQAAQRIGRTVSKSIKGQSKTFRRQAFMRMQERLTGT